MSKSILSVIVYVSLVLLSGCNKKLSLNGEQFVNKWKASEMNSAISWWYLGESNNQYFVSENMPLEKNIYAVPKSAVTILGIVPFKFNSGSKPVNLKNNNVVFN